MSDYQHSQNELIIQVRPIWFDGLTSFIYHLQTLAKRLLQGKSDGPLEVQLSLQDLRNRKTIKLKGFRRLPKRQTLWIGFGVVSEAMAKSVIRSNPIKLVLGPNIDIHNINVRKLFDTVPNSIFVVPSLWVKDYYVTNLHMDPNQIRVWTAGIDVERWNPTGVKRDSVLIYVKGNFEEHASRIQFELKKYGYKSSVLVYGHYSQTEYFELLNKSNFAIFLCGTESQGIAQFQSWAMDVPTLILKQNDYRSPLLPNVDITASSSPYLSVATGSFFDGPQDKRAIHAFLENLDSFSPRIWVKDNFSLSISSQKFVDLFS